MPAISEYPDLTSPASDDVLLGVDIHDQTEASTGSTKKMAISALALLYLAKAGGALSGPLVSASFALTDAATIAVNAALGNIATVTLGGSRTMGAPSGAADKQLLEFEVTQDGAGSRTLSWASGSGGYSFGGSSAPVLSTAAGALDLVAFRYNAGKARWLYLGSQLGF